ncbi:hypothetical protein BZG36_02857 [Bifiguratus adelaidae]|uniref:Uncharacterized protein n=1 Tax=Bifiguratus adelaidae TaxID=1938954 RepID=A0A261Y0E9_9FUNG|nr:hypothetical protein BZG36_02857 [Bifiguratus adelaidae]
MAALGTAEQQSGSKPKGHERRNSFKQSRKGSGIGRSPSRTPTTAPQRPTTPQPAKPHIPLNGFNATDVQQYLSQEFAVCMTAHQNPQAPERPEMYKPQEKAWGKTNAWSQKAATMANGTDFRKEVVKQLEQLKAS